MIELEIKRKAIEEQLKKLMAERDEIKKQWSDLETVVLNKKSDYLHDKWVGYYMNMEKENQARIDEANKSAIEPPEQE